MQPSATRQPRSTFTQPIRQLVTMVLVLGLVIAGAVALLPQVMPIFDANPALNGFIALVFVIGVVGCFWQVFQLMRSVAWVERFVQREDGDEPGAAPLLLAPLATLMRSRGRETQINATSSRSILDSVATRMDEARDITRYIVNLLVFLGLLGTFYGLATTVPAIVDTIRALDPGEGEDGIAIFGRLMGGLERQLGGMGVAFGSSLLGLAGSLVVGLLELFAAHGQNRFYRELEEWLSGITRLGLAGLDGDGPGGDGAAQIAALEHMVQQVDRLQTMFSRGEEARQRLELRIEALATALEQGGSGGVDLSPGLAQIADGQERMIALMQGGDSGGTDSHMRLRSIDIQLLRLSEEIAAGREESLQELRHEIRQLARTIASGSTGSR
ncbi:biopolymer transporter ExbB [Palleronia caenipelagi]|uniref:Biopolymer transporter ExbB n=1 Tax=Palleronia caenipelagi TaxID=2489174 RepID=A0A547Q9K5_9RHOB|nr:biopolymer transporter ExbB [Palleronia caenipelagi]TRD23078.1 biopolymer transporter ExbB [Palleronia caenipelagi]